jgi:hypothetical protein
VAFVTRFKEREESSEKALVARLRQFVEDSESYSMAGKSLGLD